MRATATLRTWLSTMITDTSFLRNPSYHTSMDTPDTLDYERMARATTGVTGGVRRLAKAKCPDGT